MGGGSVEEKVGRASGSRRSSGSGEVWCWGGGGCWFWWNRSAPGILCSGIRGSLELACSRCGRCGGSDAVLVEILSPVFVFAVVSYTLCLLWRAGGGAAGCWRWRSSSGGHVACTGASSGLRICLILPAVVSRLARECSSRCLWWCTADSSSLRRAGPVGSKMETSRLSTVRAHIQGFSLALGGSGGSGAPSSRAGLCGGSVPWTWL